MPIKKFLNLEALKEKIGFEPNPWQAGVLANLRRFTKIVGGKRTGKSFLTSYLAFREIMASERTIWIVAPTYELSTRVWDNVYPWSLKFPNTLKARKLDPILGRSIENVSTGSVIRIKSADNPKQLKGEAGDLLIAEECGDMNDDVYPKYLEPFLSEKRPGLGGEMGRGVFIGNASHKGSFFHKKWAEAQDELNISFHIPTAIEDKDGKIIGSMNPDFLAVQELQRIKKGLSERVWRQEWMAEFLASSGEVFRNIDLCTADTLKEPQPGHFYVMGLDLAKHQDWTVLTVIDVHTFEVVHIDRFNQIDWNLQKLRVFETARRYNNCEIWCDATGVGDPIFDDLQRIGLNIQPYKFTNSSKRALVEKLSIYLEQARIRIPYDQALIRELEIFTYNITSSGTMQYGAPEGEHDDMVMSLALAVWPLAESKTFSPSINIEQRDQYEYTADRY
jgi:hypothetical protein